MRAIIDADGLAEAGDYYEMFSREPGRQPADDMTINQIERIRGITLSSLMQKLIDLNEREVLIVAHGEPRGFLMSIAPRGVSAMEDALRSLMDVAPVLERRERVRTRPADEQVRAWTDLINELAPGTITGTITAEDADRWFNGQWLAGQARNLGIGRDDLFALVRRMGEVRRIGLTRVEIRACNIGKSPTAMSALKDFFGAGRLCAPSVGTFYVPVIPFVTSEERQRNAWAGRYAGSVRGGVYGRGSSPAARTFDSYVPAPHGIPMGFSIPEGFRIRVWETSRHPHLYSARAIAVNWSYVDQWVSMNIMPNTSYRGSNQNNRFILAGMWTFGTGEEPFAAPLESAYRNVLVCA